MALEGWWWGWLRSHTNLHVGKRKDASHVMVFPLYPVPVHLPQQEHRLSLPQRQFSAGLEVSKEANVLIADFQQYFQILINNFK